MSRDPGLFLEDILEACRKIETLIQGKNREFLGQDWIARDAVLRNLEVIGEAVKHLPEAIRATHSEVPWRSIVGFRNVLSHAYFIVDDDAVWDIVTRHLGPLQAAARSMVDASGM